MMPVRSAVYEPVVGAYSVFIPELAYRSIVSVKREGLGYNMVSEPPTGREVQYIAGVGEFKFENAFTGVWVVVQLPHAEILVLKPEKIFIIWKE